MMCPISRQEGVDTVTKYEAYALTPHGRLRHELLFRHTREFLKQNGVKRVVDVGGGSGLLVSRLLEDNPALEAVLIDDSAAMVQRAEERLATERAGGRVRIVQGSVAQVPDFAESGPFTLIMFNHVIEYVKDKADALRRLASAVRPGGLLGVMHLNNSEEALRCLRHGDSITGMRTQLEDYGVDMGNFGLARAADAAEIESTLCAAGLEVLVERGIRSASEFKSKAFVAENFEALRDLEMELGALPDFIGLSRYRLKFFRRPPEGGRA